jgi:hypothetical protein
MATTIAPNTVAHHIEARVLQLNNILDRVDGLYNCPGCMHDKEIEELTRKVEDEFSRVYEQLRAEAQEVHLPAIATVVYLIMLQKLQSKKEEPLQEPTGIPQNIIRARMNSFQRVGLKSLDEMKEWVDDVSCFSLPYFVVWAWLTW